MTTVKQTECLNGVDVARLKGTLAAIRRDETLASFQFRLTNRWQGGSHNQSGIRGFYGTQQQHEHPHPFSLDNDEPEVLLGDDEFPNPVEYLLHALAGCVTTTMVCHAASRGIEIESIESTLEGDIDLRGFLGLSDEVPRGFKQIRVTMRVKSDAPPDKLAELAKFSPVFSTITRATPVSVNVEPAAE